LPFFVLATQAPLLQRWFAATTHRAAGDPYFLYAASNVGSLLALLSYPVLMEPWLRLAEQARFWALGYGGLVFLVAGCVLLVWRRSVESNGQPNMETVEPLSWGRRLRWVALAFVPSSLMLGVTTHLATDIAPIPLLWVVPLALYLLSFVLAFSRLPRPFYQGSAVAFFVLVAALIAVQINRVQGLIEVLNQRYALSLPLLSNLQVSHVQAIGLHLLCFFVAALLCHGELAVFRPAPSRLTEYYLWIALGGMLGGIFNSIVAPLVFDHLIEYPLLFAAVCLLRPRFGWSGTPRIGWSRLLTATYLLFGLIASVCFIAEAKPYDPGYQETRVRNFFGTLLASHYPPTGKSELIHGTTLHGSQDISSPAARQEPQSYYTRTSGIGRIFDSGSLHRPQTVGAIGLGAGTVAAYALPGENWIFYEINPAVPRLAQDPRYFTYLDDARKRGANMQIVLGDARLSVAAGSNTHDLLIVDAFSSDAIPIHLLTREALLVYLAKLSPHGLIAFHVTNHYADLTRVLADLARNLGLSCAFFADKEARYRSWWMVLAPSAGDIAGLFKGPAAWQKWNGPRWEWCLGRSGVPVWTDDFSNLYGALHLAGVGEVPQALLDNVELLAHERRPGK
jgi:hypothetical protein